LSSSIVFVGEPLFLVFLRCLVRWPPFSLRHSYARTFFARYTWRQSHSKSVAIYVTSQSFQICRNIRHVRGILNLSQTVKKQVQVGAHESIFQSKSNPV
jgi:hypothetical protein